MKPGDKRIANRAKRRLMVRYGTSSAEKTAFTRNVSETGLFVQTNQVLKPGSTIQVSIQFRGQKRRLALAREPIARA